MQPPLTSAGSPAGTPSDPLPFRVLFLCTANYCRSPIAERLLTTRAAHLLGPGGGWRIESAGTDVRVERPMHEFSAQVLAERGVTAGDQVSRMMTKSLLSDADVILTAAREHRAAAVRMLPAAIGRTFTVLQFARLASAVQPLASDDPAMSGRQLIVEAKAARAILQPVSPEEDDLPDPMGRQLGAFRVCADTLEVAVASILAPLRR